jgi:preprotein translocase subunit SecE
MLGVRIPPGLPFPSEQDTALDKVKQIWFVIEQFLKESRAELKKVTWPTSKQTIASTSVVIVITVIVSLALGLVDFGLAKIIRVILG